MPRVAWRKSDKENYDVTQMCEAWFFVRERPPEATVVHDSADQSQGFVNHVWSDGISLTPVVDVDWESVDPVASLVPSV